MVLRNNLPRSPKHIEEPYQAHIHHGRLRSECLERKAAASLRRPGDPAHRLVPLDRRRNRFNPPALCGAPGYTGSAYGPPSERLRVPIAFLQNTHEQVTIAAFAMLALTTVPGEAPLAFIMTSVPLFAIGRITFLRGYPHGAAARAFGMVTTGLPSLGAFVWVIYDMVDGLLRGTI